jgi:diketogulonate reductase-like aldo/keto reductase
MEYVKLSNGVEVPQLGFGVFQILPNETKDAVSKAIEEGYRHFDTAQAYRMRKEWVKQLQKAELTVMNSS